ncbi:MAG: thioredoxin family protein [Nitrospirae bacterium]|nr:thioredoxin family protein [Nitrospirota bacterium]
MRKYIGCVFAFIVFWSQATQPASAAEPSYTILYFYSSTCPHCKNVAPVMKDLSKEYKIQGLLYGKDAGEQMPYEVKKGDKATSSKYGVKGVPSLVMLKDDKFRLKIAGEHNIKDAPLILKAFRKGALTVSEAIEKGPRKTYTVIGWIGSRGEYFKNARFVLTDRKRTISVKPWLPLEAVKSPFKKARPRLMSDVIDKPVLIEGLLTKINDDLQFTVRKEIILE